MGGVSGRWAIALCLTCLWQALVREIETRLGWYCLLPSILDLSGFWLSVVWTIRVSAKEKGIQSGLADGAPQRPWRIWSCLLLHRGLRVGQMTGDLTKMALYHSIINWNLIKTANLASFPVVSALILWPWPGEKCGFHCRHWAATNLEGRSGTGSQDFIMHCPAAFVGRQGLVGNNFSPGMSYLNPGFLQWL